MKNLKTRLIALLLTIITVFSIFSVAAISASATDCRRKAFILSHIAKDNSTAAEEEEDELEEEEAFYKEDDTGLDFDLDVKSSLGEVMYEMVYRMIDHLAEDHWVGSVFAMGGLVILKSIYDATGLKKQEPSPDTEMILDAVDKLSEKVSENHDEAMKSLKKINANIDTQGFRKQADQIVSDYNEVSKVIDASGVKADATEGVLSKSQYNAYKNALSSRELDFSTLQKNYDNMEKFISGKSFTADKKAGYISYSDYVVSKIDDENSGHDFNRSVDLKPVIKNIRKEINSINNACILDCATIATIANMDYKIAEYEEANGIKEKDKDNPPMNRLKKRLKQLDTTTKSMRKFYVKACKYIKNLGEAKVKFGSVEKNFSSFGDAWATAYKSGNKATVTLLKDIKADGAKGLNTAGLGNDYGFNEQGGLLAKDGKTITLDFNKHTINCASKAFNFINFESTSGVTFKNGTIKNATRAVHLTAEANKQTKIELDKMTITDTRDGALYLDNQADISLTITDSVIKGTKKGSGLFVKWGFNCTVSGTTFESNNNPYGGGAYLLYTNDCKKPITFTNCKFINNTSQYEGGGLWGGAKLTKCTFKGNYAGSKGGALYNKYEMRDSDSTNEQDKNTVDNCTFENNTSENGGAYACEIRCNTTKNCVFKNNKATKDGGAIYYPADLYDSNVENAVFEGNSAGCDGGAICACAHSDLNIKCSTLKGNSANNGGAVYLGALSFSDHHFTSVTITNNSARSHGGGIYANAGAFKAADVKLYGGIQICGNGKENAYMVSDSAKKSVFKTTSTFDSGHSNICITSSTNSDIAVVDLNAKAHEGAFHADNGRRIYRGTFHFYTLYLDKV